ncbi:MAG TPA: Ldh family oxidoreductase [Burkholderiaceae bacterium]|nr:Ldh family oxidoreductase [Burkholderiaceae bacterium]
MRTRDRVAGAVSSPPAVRHVSASSLTAWAIACLTRVGVRASDAETVARSLVQTSLWGIDSHGIARLGHYMARIKAGSIAPIPALRIKETGPCTATIDGGHGLGIVVCTAAMAHAIGLARSNGVGIVGIGESSHCGAIGLYTRQATAAGLIGFAFTHADSIVAPAGGAQKLLGTNPLSIAFPNPDGPPICLDMATSSIAWNRVMNARREGHALPEAVAINQSGTPTRDAQEAAALLPLGGSEYGHKGYALALMIDLLCGPLNGMPFADRIPPMFADLQARRHLGSLVMALDPMRFAGGPTLALTVRELIATLRRQRGDVQYPGEPEARREAVRAREGIPVEPGLWSEFADWSARLGLPLPEEQ